MGPREEDARDQARGAPRVRHELPRLAPRAVPGWRRRAGALRWSSWRSEFRYRDPVVGRATSSVAVSQSGETADTLGGAEGGPAAARRVSPWSTSQGARSRGIAHGTPFTRTPGPRSASPDKRFTAQLAAPDARGVRRAPARSRREAAGRSSGVPPVPHKMREALADARHVDPRPRNHAHARRALPRPRALQRRRPGGRAQAQGDPYIHAEGYAGGEMKHGPSRAGRPRHARRVPPAERLHPREDGLQRPGGARPRRPGDRRGR